MHVWLHVQCGARDFPEPSAKARPGTGRVRWKTECGVRSSYLIVGVFCFSLNVLLFDKRKTDGARAGARLGKTWQL